MLDTKLIDYINEWMETYKKHSVRSSTYQRLEVSVNALKKYPIAQMPISQITVADVQRYVNSLESDYAYTGILKMMRIVTAPLAKAAALHQIPADPAVGIELPNRQRVRIKPRQVEAYTEEEQIKLLAVLYSSDDPAKNIVSLMMQTGLRIGEILSLDWTDLDLKGRFIRIHKTMQNPSNASKSIIREGAKSFKSNRLVPLNDKALDILKQVKAYNDGTPKQSNAVFLNKDGMRISYQQVQKATKKFCKAAGIPYRGEHVFRHTFATNKYNKKVDIKVLSQILGHSSTTVTYDIYINLFGGGLDAMREAMNA